jgi:hypothetical protein
MATRLLEKKWKLIGGYGEIGNVNWGFDQSKVETEKWVSECQKHIGEIVLLTGGGSFGESWLATLTKVSIEMLGDKPTPRVRLENLKPKWNSYGEDNVFEPYLGSWQISVLEEVKNGNVA